MKALLKKDMYTILNNYKVLIYLAVVGVVFLVMFKDPTFMTMFLGMMVMQVVYNTFSYDESAKWDVFAVALPLERKTIVLEKYLLLLGGMLSAVVLGGAIVCGHGLLRQIPVDYQAFFMSVLVLVSLYLFTFSIVLPVVFKAGVEKARYVGVAATILPFLGGVWLLDHMPAVQQLPVGAISLGAVVLVAVALFVSYRVSVKLYETKEF